MLNHILTAGGIHMVIQGKPVTVAKSDKHFQTVVDALNKKATEAEVLDILENEKRRLEAAVEVAPGIEMKGGQLFYQGEVVAGVLGTRMLQMVEEGFNLAPMAAFLANLMNNPSKRVVDHLYAFLEHGKNPITDDGYFLAYKAVRADYLDIHSGTFDNSVGRVVTMPRNRVNEDPSQTCSAGLHVCSYDYLPSFANANGHVMVCKVNPADVVAIPRDYNDTKMRVCRYEVVSEYEGYYKQEGDTLSATSVAAGEGTFVVEYSEGDDIWHAEPYDRLSEAAERMDELLEDTAVEKVRVVNTKTAQVLDERENEDFDGSSIERQVLEDDLTYQIVGFTADASEVLEEGFHQSADALQAALNYDDYLRIEIQDSEGQVVRTLS